MTSYCSIADLIALTDTTLDTTTLQAIIDDGDREINAYLRARGVSGAASDDLKTASLRLANAGLILRNPTGAEGGATPLAINILRKSAFEILDNYLSYLETTNSYENVPRFTQAEVRRCDVDIGDMALDTISPIEFFTET